MGPLGRSVADLEIATRVAVDASVGLSKLQGLIPLPYREVTLPEKLKFGYYLTGERVLLVKGSSARTYILPLIHRWLLPSIACL